MRSYLRKLSPLPELKGVVVIRSVVIELLEILGLLSYGESEYVPPSVGIEVQDRVIYLAVVHLIEANPREIYLLSSVFCGVGYISRDA